jgi:hypothetical protein
MRWAGLLAGMGEKMKIIFWKARGKETVRKT